MAIRLTTYYHSEDLPDLPGSNIFHSRELFQIYEATPRYAPLLIVVSEDGRPLGKLLAAVRSARCWLPSFLHKQCIVYGAGEILDGRCNREEVFGRMLEHLTRAADEDCWMTEFRNLDHALFGYKHFRESGYFYVNWLRVRNSLHGTEHVEQRFSASRIRQIRKGLKNGAVVREAETNEEVLEFGRMFRRIYSGRIRRHFPDKDFFRSMNRFMQRGRQGKIFVVEYKGKIIGGSVCLYSGKDAYLWFSGGMTKTHALQYPGILSVWGALQDAHRRGYRHLEFMDVGLPFRHHGYREFVLRFGGKQSSTKRWFRFRWRWLDKLFIKIYV